MDGAHRSVHPNIPGAPWYAALLIAVTATAIGYGIDAGHKELTHVFAGFYIAGCVAAVLAVRQDGIFTTIIQPPLILFCAVPGAYWLFHDAKVGRLKDLLINCGYPLIERFPLMLGTAGAVLAIGLARWYFGNAQGTKAASTSADSAGATGVHVKSFFNSIGAKLQSALQPDADDTDEATESRRGTARRARRPGHAERRATVAPPRVPAPGMRDRPSTTSRSSGPSVHGAVPAAILRPPATTTPNRPAGHGAGPGRRATRTRAAKPPRAAPRAAHPPQSLRAPL